MEKDDEWLLEHEACMTHFVKDGKRDASPAIICLSRPFHKKNLVRDDGRFL